MNHSTTVPDSTSAARAAHLFTATAGARRALARHPVHSALHELSQVRRFTEQHVFAVWDFMSLLKAIQVRLTCTGVPWRPVGSPAARRLVNEIVLAEESDAHPEGGFASHFELYVEAMDRIGADRGSIDRFVRLLEEGRPVGESLARAEVPGPARAFVAATFELVDGGSLPALVAAFCLGREALLPDVFRRLSAGVVARRAPLLHAYFERHVELDGGDHGPAAQRLLAEVCGDDERAWIAAERGAELALTARRAFWDGLAADLARAPVAATR